MVEIEQISHAKTIGDLLKRIRKVYCACGMEEESHESLWIVCHLLKKEPAYIYACSSDEVLKKHTTQAIAIMEKRRQSMPLAYILGYTYFMDLKIEVDQHVLIPRKETELCVEHALRLLEKDRSYQVLDIGTGSGCIALALAHYHQGVVVDAIDCSHQALRMAMRNRNRFKMEHRVHLIKADLFPEKCKKYDMIISNPPYVSRLEYDQLPASVRMYEPATALKADEDGTEFYRKIAFHAPSVLCKGGRLIFEIGFAQAKRVCLYMQQAGFDRIQVEKDLNGLDRMVVGRHIG